MQSRENMYSVGLGRMTIIYEIKMRILNSEESERQRTEEMKIVKCPTSKKAPNGDSTA